MPALLLTAVPTRKSIGPPISTVRPVLGAACVLLIRGADRHTLSSLAERS
jgi:hypothetical protein